ncbi:MAG: hypothetical protein M3Q95_01655 [Bacteroidota bacterium]|nr:hypothetical protein [Bacteroidota bacterium]
MSKTSTTEKLVLYLFNETGMTDSVLIQRSIDNDDEVEMEFTNIKRAFRFVDRALVDPSPASVNRILQYASHTAVKEN